MPKKDSCRKWFCRVTKFNNSKNGPYEYDFEDLYKTLSSKYDVLFALHDKDLSNVHCHIVIQGKNQIEFDRLKNLMPYGDIEKQRGSNEECYKYLLHIDDKSKDTEKDVYDESCLKTNIENLDEWKKIKQGQRDDLIDFRNAILSGMSRSELIDEFPAQMVRYSKFYNVCKSAKMEDEFCNKLRDVKVTYIYGGAGFGKTYSVYAENDFNYLKIYSVDDYSHPFDNYNGEDVILFDEYRSNFTITYLLKLLDKYPLKLKARYENKTACYTKVYIVSNIPLKDQYINCDNATRFALYRRLTEIRHYTGYNKYENDLINGLLKVNDDIDDVFA